MKAISKSLVIGSVALLVLCLMAGCGTKKALFDEHAQLTMLLQETEEMGAKVCAPMEYASAEANLDFAKEEWFERDYMKSKDHLKVARQQVLEAKKLSINCIETAPPDTDGDGINDDKDACPKQPEDFDGFQDADGCPDPDNDGDGIPDVSDKCINQPETMNGIKDEDGCPDQAFKKIEVTAKQIVLKEKIHFQTGKSSIQIDSFGILEEVVEALRTRPDIRIRIEGHTDSTGSLSFNEKLSASRADSVRQFLIGKGIDPIRMTSEGFGPSRPIAPNITENGRAKNRRVEIHIVK